MSARATAIAVVALPVLGIAMIAPAWRMKAYSPNVSIARERQDDDPEMLRNYHRYFGATEVRFWSGSHGSAARTTRQNERRVMQFFLTVRHDTAE